MSGRSNYYNPESDSGAAIFVVVGLVITLIIVGIILALYFTCTAPFNTDSCICSKSSGTWDDTKTPKCTCKTTDDLFDKKCVIKCKTGETRDDKGVCVGIPLNNPPNTPNNPTCPNNQILLNGSCVCPTGTEKDVDNICKNSSIYLTNKFGYVLCPTGFTTTRYPTAYVNDVVCSPTSGKCDVCVTTNTIYPTTYTRKGQTLDWPAREWADPMEQGFDITPTITGGRTMGYSGGTYITTAMPFDG